MPVIECASAPSLACPAEWSGSTHVAPAPASTSWRANDPERSAATNGERLIAMMTIGLWLRASSLRYQENPSASSQLPGLSAIRSYTLSTALGIIPGTIVYDPTEASGPLMFVRVRSRVKKVRTIAAWALAGRATRSARGRPRKMDFTGRPMAGYVLIDPAGIEDDEDLVRWLQACLAFVRTLPPGRRRGRSASSR